MPYVPNQRRLSDEELETLVEFHRNGTLSLAQYEHIMQRANAAAVAAGITNYVRIQTEREREMPDVQDGVGGEEPGGAEAQDVPVERRSILGNVIPDEPDVEPWGYCESCNEDIDDENDAYWSDWDGCARCWSCDDSHREYVEEEERRSGGWSSYVRGYCGNPPQLWVFSTETEADGKMVPAVRKLRSSRPLTGKKLVMGFELETECEDEYAEAAEWAHTQGNNWFICDGEKVRSSVLLDEELMSDYDYSGFLWLKSDASLSNGFEIVTSPASLEFYENFFNWDAISGLSRFGNNAWNRSSCGLHIHLNKSSFASDKHLWKFIVFLYKNASALVTFAGRDSSYATWSRSNFLNYYSQYGDEVPSHGYMKHAKLEAANNHRYTAVNLQPVSTVELRFFRPSLLPGTVLAALQFCDALHVYTEKITTKEVLDGGLKWAKFRGWVAESGRWPVLDERIKVRFDENNGEVACDEHSQVSV